MRWRVGFAAICLALPIAVSGCGQPQSGMHGLRRQIAFGEQVFTAKKCGDCHQESAAETVDTSRAPDLSSIFVAMDTLFVRSHLQSPEYSDMPRIELSPHEIYAVTQYIGVLHAQARMDPNLKKPDAVCPVCGAPVKSSAAEEVHLVVDYQGKTFYFECPDCKVVFAMDPSWYSQSGWLSTKRGVLDFLD